MPPQNEETSAFASLGSRRASSLGRRRPRFRAILDHKRLLGDDAPTCHPDAARIPVNAKLFGALIERMAQMNAIARGERSPKVQDRPAGGLACGGATGGKGNSLVL